MTTPATETREAVARMICLQRGANPDCRHEGKGPAGEIDGVTSCKPTAIHPSGKRPWHYGWRIHLKAADAILAPDGPLAALQASAARTEEAERERDEARAEAERLRQEADGEFVQAAIEAMQSYEGFDARDYRDDGITADDFRSMFQEDMTEAWRQTEEAVAQAATAQSTARAATEQVERLKAENARLRQALEPFDKFCGTRFPDGSLCTIRVYARELRAVRTALLTQEPPHAK